MKTYATPEMIRDLSELVTKHGILGSLHIFIAKDGGIISVASTRPELIKELKSATEKILDNYIKTKEGDICNQRKNR